MIWLASVTVHDPALPGARTIRACSSTGYNHPTAPGFFEGAMLAPGGLVREVWPGEGAYGAGHLSVGDLSLASTGWLDWLAANRVGFGHAASLHLLADNDTPYAQAVPVLSGTVETAVHGWDRVSFRWRDGLAGLLDKAGQVARYAGDNAPPDGVEGTADDLKDRYKPEWWGRCLNVAAPCVNAPKRIYQLSARRMAAVTACYDGGAPAAVGVERADIATLLATAPAAGAFDWCLGDGGSYVRLGFEPAGTVTVDGHAGATAADRTVGQIWRRMLEYWGVAAIAAADVAALDAAVPGEIGLWMGTDDMVRREALDAVAATAGAVYWLAPDGAWRIAQAAAPAGDPVATFRRFAGGAAARRGDGDIIDFEWDGETEGEGNPVYSISLNYGCNWTIQDAGSLAGAGLARAAWLAQQWRRRTATDETVPTAHPLAREAVEDTLFVDAAAAAAEASRRLAMRRDGGPRRARMTVMIDPAMAAALDLMAVVAVHLPRWGLDGGALFRVTRIDLDPARGRAELRVVR